MVLKPQAGYILVIHAIWKEGGNGHFENEGVSRHKWNHNKVLKLPMILEVFEEELISGNNRNHVSLGSH